MISLGCTACGKSIKAEDSLAGKRSDCPECGTSVPVPSSPGPAKGKDPAPSADLPYELRCDRCQALVRDESLTRCAFCGEDFTKQGARRRTVRRTTAAPGGAGLRKPLVGIIAAVWGAAAVVVAVLMATPGREVASGPEERCLSNVDALYAALRRCEAEGSLPPDVGRSFWRAVAKKGGATDHMGCPAVSSSGKDERVDYRGPKWMWRDLKEDAIILADAPENHPAGLHILFKHGGMVFAALGSPLHQRALAETRD